MRLAAALLLLALLLAPPASAGTERDPEIRDPQDQRRGGIDLLAAWFETHERGVRFHIRTADGTAPADHVYWVSFRVEGRSVSAALGFGPDGEMRGHLGALDGPAWTRGGFELVANGELLGLREERGRPGTWSAIVPWSAARGLEEGARLTELTAGTALYDREARQWRGGLDVASSERDFVAKPPLLPIIVPAWVIPTIVAACTGAGMAGGLVVARLTRRTPRAPTPVPVRKDAPSAPAPRFQRAPPGRP